MEEHIAESTLASVFHSIKGESGKHRSYINIDDFRRAVLFYKPNSIEEIIAARQLGKKGEEEFNMNVEDLFRNICETVSPVVDPDDEGRVSNSQRNTDTAEAKPAKPKKKLK